MGVPRERRAPGSPLGPGRVPGRVPSEVRGRRILAPSAGRFRRMRDRAGSP
ncbi:MAG TPA: hypothetical protein VET83_00495 [Candidatus Dormibacteraeota bacterium]|nr:hypothetical protein [Candidatus Dormibacteraeota bacterium]